VLNPFIEQRTFFMRVCFAALFLAALPVCAMAAPVSPAEAVQRIGGGVMTVEGIASISTPSTGTVTFVEVGLPGNSAIVQGVILDGDRGKFPDLASYNGKKVQITGSTQTFTGTMRIVLSSPDQLKLAEPKP
jgi:DNA/RNA endonuclease YhcR with UshA esterase domain